MHWIIRRLAHALRRRVRCRPAVRPRSRPRLEQFETRELPSATAIGMNLEPVRDYMAAWMFTDAFKESRPWIPENYNLVTHQVTLGNPNSVQVNAKGWPTQLVRSTNAQGQAQQQILETMMYDGLSGHYPPGTYTAWWQGTGTVQWGGDVTVTSQGTMANGTHFALLADRPGNFGIDMRITAMSSTDPIHDVHVWMPDYNGQSFVGQVWHPGASFSPFHPLFLQRLQPFGTLRFMQMQETISSQVQHWSDLKPYDYATQATSQFTFQNGVAPEYMIELCNELNANMWVNIPHMADNTFIRNLATEVRDTLKPGLQVYLEWSNEVWNGAPGFIPRQWVTQQLALPQNAGLTFYQFVANEFRNSFDIWSQAFAGQNNRLVRVLAGFEESPGYTSHLLQSMNGDFDAISCAAYFGPTSPQRATYNASTTEPQIMNDTISSIPTDVNFLNIHRQLANQYATQLHRPIQLVAYEGGANLTAGWTPYQAAMNAASLDPRMYDAFRQFLTSANGVRLDLYVNFQYTDRYFAGTPYGVFGSLNYQDEALANAPNYRALLDAAHGLFFPTTRPPLNPAGSSGSASTGTSAVANSHAVPAQAPLVGTAARGIVAGQRDDQSVDG